jgi:hypothetical protein
LLSLYWVHTSELSWGEIDPADQVVIDKHVRSWARAVGGHDTKRSPEVKNTACPAASDQTGPAQLDVSISNCGTIG